MVYGLLSKSMVCGLWSISYGLWSMAYGPFPMVYGLWSKSMVYALLRGVAAAAGRKGTAARAAAVPGGERGGCHAMVQTMLWSRFVDVVCEFSMVYGQGLTLGAALMVVCVCVCVCARARAFVRERMPPPAPASSSPAPGSSHDAPQTIDHMPQTIYGLWSPPQTPGPRPRGLGRSPYCSTHHGDHSLYHGDHSLYGRRLGHKGCSPSCSMYRRP